MNTMRALVLTGKGAARVEEVAAPVPGAGEVVVDIHRAGICGTDVELFTGELPYFAQGRAWYPLRPGHEWAGTVRAVGSGVDDSWLDRRVTGDTMLACGRCDRCRRGHGHVCRNLVEVGISMGFAGALAEQLLVPVESLHPLPAELDDTAGAMVEPGGNAWRAVAAARLTPGSRVAVWGPGTIGLLAALFALAEGAEVHVVGVSAESLELARSLGIEHTWSHHDLPELPFDAVIDATDAPSVPAAVLDQVEPAGRVVYIGVARSPSPIDSRTLVLKDVTAVGILGAQAGLVPAIERYADGVVRPQPLVLATVELDRAPEVLDGWRPAGTGTKVHIDPRQ